MTLPLYRRIIGKRFDELPPLVRELHDLEGTSVWKGRAEVQRGRSLVSRLVGALSSLPPAGDDHALHVTFSALGERELWERQFGTSLFRSVQYERNGLLCERVAVTTFVFATFASPQGLALEIEGFRVLGVPLPRFLHPTVRTFESERDGRYRFEVEAHLPLFGLLVRYAGWLEPAAPKR